MSDDYCQSGDYYYVNADTLETETAHRAFVRAEQARVLDVMRPPLTRDDARYAITEAGLQALQTDATAFGSEWA